MSRPLFWGQVTAADLIKRMKEKKKKAFIYMNNRLEGNALKTVANVLENFDT